MIRKAAKIAHWTLVVVLTVGAFLALAVEVISKLQSCPCDRRAPAPARLYPCPVRLYLGLSERGQARFVYAVSESWLSTVGYLRWWSDSEFDEEGEKWFHGICVMPMHYPPDGRVPRVVRSDDVFPSHLFLRALVVPRGSVFVAFGVYPTIVIIRTLRCRRRRKRGLCVACGYNLKGLPEPRCPECGREFER
jgi:hypothetical protein